jgi:hypothetical protein
MIVAGLPSLPPAAYPVLSKNIDSLGFRAAAFESIRFRNNSETY